MKSLVQSKGGLQFFVGQSWDFVSTNLTPFPEGWDSTFRHAQKIIGLE